MEDAYPLGDSQENFKRRNSSRQDTISVAVITTDSYMSYLLLSQVLAHPRVSCVTLVILPSTGKESLTKTARRVYRQSGGRWLIYKAVTSLPVLAHRQLIRLGAPGIVRTPRALAHRRRIPVVLAEDCNDDRVVKIISSSECDLLLSVNVYQRMHEPLLRTPRLSALNTHFGQLPHYRGMSPVLWAMSNGDGSIGLTVHKMVIAFDEGLVVRQGNLRLRDDESVLSATIRGCERARGLLLESVLHIAEDPGFGLQQIGEGSYFSLPTRAAIAQLRRRGRGLWRLRDLTLFRRSTIAGERLP